ncbi:hypothetical protein INS49_014939 [Diaporthe citri]|uniref:uncharacterized protein n=1 Tax=Diaporthe citri TaxID=83186 RepID=UPI001C818567|nr:uncharacterized protein INS49_014939 [Diaporthe citri]KAG6357062.1 hypothetical protein INS49_014939 [Diaporthe citri]
MGPPHTAVGDQVDAVAQDTTLLSAADCEFIKEFQGSLSAETANDRDCGGLSTAILRHLGHFKERIQVECVGSEQGQQDHTLAALPPLPDVWGPVIAEARASQGGPEVSITGPGPDDHFQVHVSSPDDASRTIAFVAGVDAACRIIKGMYHHCVLVIKKHRELEERQSRLRQPAESTVSEHIKLLRQYNKVKDVGQQLIGLNADNRGVPVGSLYTDEHYGVGPKD